MSNKAQLPAASSRELAEDQEPFPLADAGIGL
jgi:hypothetical protein